MQATMGTLTRRRLLAGAAAAISTAILAACSEETSPTATPILSPTAPPMASPTRAMLPASSTVAGSVTVTPGASVVVASPGTVAGSATATRVASIIAGSPSVIVPPATTTTTAGSPTAGATATRGVGSPSAVASGTAAGGGMANIRVVHASPDAPAVDVYIDGRQVIAALPFSKDSPYQAITSGRHDIQVFATGANPLRDRPVIDGRGTSIGADARLTVIALGRLMEPVRGVLADDRTAAPAAGKAKVKFIHAAPDAPAVDIAVRGGAVLFPNTEYMRSYPYQEIDARMYDLEVRLAGRTDVVLAVPGVNLVAGQIYSLYALGFVSGTPALSAGLFTDR